MQRPPGGRNPFLAHVEELQRERGNDANGLFGNAPNRVEERNSFKTLFNIFAPLDSKEVFDLLRTTRNEFNETRKKYRDTNEDDKISKILREMKD